VCIEQRCSLAIILLSLLLTPILTPLPLKRFMFSTLCRVLTLITQQINHKFFKRGFQVNIIIANLDHCNVFLGCKVRAWWTSDTRMRELENHGRPPLVEQPSFISSDKYVSYVQDSLSWQVDAHLI